MRNSVNRLLSEARIFCRSGFPFRGNDGHAGNKGALWGAAMRSSGPGALELYCHEVTVRFVESAVVPHY
jgi:hypothetical protein